MALESLWQDVRYGWRMLRKSPGFTAVAVITLALAIGANTAMFSVVHGALLRALPYQQPERLVKVWEVSPRSANRRNVVSPSNFVRWRERNRVFEQMAMLSLWPANVSGVGEPERLASGNVSPSLFAMTGVNAVLGRTFLAEEERPGNGRVALLTYGYWQRHFGGDASAVGRTIQVDGEPFRIVGVLPQDFKLMPEAEMYFPLTISQRMAESTGRWVQVLAQLKPGVTAAQAQAEMDVIARQLQQERPQANADWGVNVVPLHEDLVGDVRRGLLILLGAVGFILLIGCANVANLLLARATLRERELAMRTALGVRRGRLVRQLLTESLLLSLLGGLAGVALAYWGLDALLALIPEDMQAIGAISIDRTVLLFTFGLTLLTGVIFGVAPALHMSKLNLYDALKESGQTASAGGSRKQMRSVLVVAETALAVMLLVGAGLLIRSFAALRNVDPGYGTDSILTMQVSLATAKYPQQPQQVAFFQQAIERIQALPDVQHVAAISWTPLQGGAATDFRLDDRPAPVPGQEPVADVRVITPEYFRVMGTPLLRGRVFHSDDRGGNAVKSVIINETLARTYWPGQDPIGKRISMEWFEMLHAEVVGVVKDARLRSLNEPARPTIYWHMPQFPSQWFMTLAVRTKGEPMAAAGAIRAQIAAMDAEQPVGDIVTMGQVVSDSLQQPRFSMVLLAVFAGLALTLAAVGLYGVTSYSVLQRTREIGLRMALGASARAVGSMVLSQGTKLVGLVVAIGLVASLALTRLMSTMLFGVKPIDATTFLAVAVVLGAVALAATYVPARRAMRVDPMVALRYE